MKYRKMLTCVIRTAKKNYLKSRENENAGNSKKMQEVINGLLGRNDSDNVTCFTHENKSITDKNIIANTFNNYFCCVVMELIEGIQPAQTSFETYLPDPVIHSFSVEPTTLTEVKDVISNLKVASNLT